MSRERREGVFWSLAKSGAIRLQNAWKNSLFVGALRAYERVEERFLNGRFSSLEEKPVASDTPLIRVKNALMQSREKSVLLSLYDAMRARILRLPIARIGLFVWLSVLFGAVFAVFLELPVSGADQALLTFLLLSVIPLFASRRTLASAIRGSATLGLLGRRAWQCVTELPAETVRSTSVAVPSLLPISVFAGWLLIRVGACRLLGAFLAMLGVGVLLSSPERCLVLALSTFPFLQLLAHPTVVLAGLCALLLLSWGIKAACGRRELSIEVYDLPAVLFCLLLLFGGLISRGDVADGLVAALLASAFLPARRLLAEEKCRHAAQMGLMISSSLVALIGVWQFFFGDLPVLWVDRNRFFDAPGRVSALFGNPNLLAIYLLLCLPHALLGACNRHRSTPIRTLFAFGAALQSFCLILTWSRGAWLGFLLELVLFLLFYNSTTRAVALISPIPLVAALPWVPHRITDRFLSIGELTESSIRYRLYTWQGVGRMVVAYPHGIGVGEQAFSAVYPQYAVSGTERVMHAHNVFLTVAIELGIAGLAVFGLLLALPLLRAVVHARISAGVLSISGALAMGLFDHLWYERGMLFLLLVSLAWAIVGEEEEEWNPRILA